MEKMERHPRAKISDAYQHWESISNHRPSSPISGEELLSQVPSDTQSLPDYIVEQVTHCTLKTAAGLEELWDEVGYGYEDRVGFVDLLLQAVGRVCDERIEEEQRLRNKLIAHTQQVWNEIEQISIRLGQPLPEVDEEREAYMFGENYVYLTLTDRLALLEVQCDELKQEESKRKAYLEELYEEMAHDKENMSDPLEPEWKDITTDLSEERISMFEEKVNEVRVEKRAREARIVELVLKCHELFRELKWDPQLPLDYMVMSSLDPFSDEPRLRVEESNPGCVGLSRHSIDRLIGKIEELTEVEALRREQRTQQVSELEELWEKLNTPQSERNEFLEELYEKGLSEAGMDFLDKQLEMKKSEQKVAFGGLIRSTREEIESLLKQMEYSVEEIVPEHMEFLSADNCLENAALLESCMNTRDIVKSVYDRISPIYKNIEKYENLLKEKEETLATQQHIDYSARGSTLSEQLRRYDSMKRRIKEKLPKHEELLKAQLVEWEETEQVPVRWKGRRYLDFIEENEMAQIAKQEMQSASSRLARKIPLPVKRQSFKTTSKLGSNNGNLAPEEGLFKGKHTRRNSNGSTTSAMSTDRKNSNEDTNPLLKEVSPLPDSQRRSNPLVQFDLTTSPRNPIFRATVKGETPTITARHHSDGNMRPLNVTSTLRNESKLSKSVYSSFHNKK